MYFDKSLKEFKLGNSGIPKVKYRIPRNSSLENLEFLRLKYPRTPKKSRIPKVKSRIPRNSSLGILEFRLNIF